MSSSPFLNSISEFMLVRRYSRRTIDSYLYWIKYFIVFNKKKHPSEMGDNEVEAFLTHLAVQRNVAAATQGIALNALVFLYNKVLEKPLNQIGDFKRSSRQRKLTTVLTREEVSALLSQLESVHLLMASILYGSGLRRMELVRLRVKDGKGFKHRLVTLAPELKEAIILMKQM